jgi:predicted transcriptional regulator
LIQSFNLLDIYTTIIANYDSNNKKLFSFANTYRTNALVDISHEKGNSGTSIYKNGLATSLPLLMESG